MSKVCQHISLVDRRHGMRASRILALRHRLIPPRNLAHFSEWSFSSTKDMSYSGLLFLSSRPYHLGDIIELQVVMSGVIDIYNGRAEVTRVHEISAVAFDIGVRFILARPAVRPAKMHLKEIKP